MLGDPTGNICKSFDSYIEGIGLAERATFVINPDCEIVAYEVSSGNVGRSAKELLRKVKALQFVYHNVNKVCPAAWEEDDEPMIPSIQLVGKL